MAVNAPPLNSNGCDDGGLRNRSHPTNYAMNDHHQILSTPSHEDSSPVSQTLDEYLETAFQSTKGPFPTSSFSVVRAARRQWKYWCIMLSLGVANSSDASEILCVSYILSDEQFQRHILRHDHPGQDDQNNDNASLLAAAVFLGMLLGGLVVGTMGDWLGRRPMLLLGLCCNAVAGTLSSLAPNVGTLSLLRCVSGLGIGATVPPLFTLVTEVAPPSARGFCVTLCASFWMVGSIYVALAALWLLEAWHFSWRVFALACALPSAVGATLVYYWVPESPRFLGLERRSQEATDNANLLGQRMGYIGPPLTSEGLERSFSESSVRDFERHVSRMALSNHLQQSRLQSGWNFLKMAFLDFFQSASNLYTPSLKQTTWPLQMVWFSLSFGSYGLLTWINTIFVRVHLENVYFNALLFAVSNLPGNMITAIFMDRSGRGVMLTGSVVAAAMSLVSFAFFANSENATGIVWSACLFQCFTIAAWNTIDTMTSELFPTLVRSTGMGICTASGRIGAMLAQFVNGALVAAHPVRLLLVAAGTLLLGAATPCLLPGSDMTGKVLHDGVDVIGTSMVPLTAVVAVQNPLYKDDPSRSDLGFNLNSSSSRSEVV